VHLARHGERHGAQGSVHDAQDGKRRRKQVCARLRAWEPEAFQSQGRTTASCVPGGCSREKLQSGNARGGTRATGARAGSARVRRSARPVKARASRSAREQVARYKLVQLGAPWLPSCCALTTLRRVCQLRARGLASCLPPQGPLHRGGVHGGGRVAWEPCHKGAARGVGGKSAGRRSARHDVPPAGRIRVQLSRSNARARRRGASVHAAHRWGSRQEWGGCHDAWDGWWGWGRGWERGRAGLVVGAVKRGYARRASRQHAPGPSASTRSMGARPQQGRRWGRAAAAHRWCVSRVAPGPAVDLGACGPGKRARERGSRRLRAAALRCGDCLPAAHARLPAGHCTAARRSVSGRGSPVRSSRPPAAPAAAPSRRRCASGCSAAASSSSRPAAAIRHRTRRAIRHRTGRWVGAGILVAGLGRGLEAGARWGRARIGLNALLLDARQGATRRRAAVRAGASAPCRRIGTDRD
jgi:hypothetical protein